MEDLPALIFGTLGLLLIGIVGFAWQNRQEEERAQEAEREQLRRDTALSQMEVPMDGHMFEHWVAAKLKQRGWDAIVTPGSGDQGVDIICSKHGYMFGIQCKRVSNSLGNTPVQEIIAGGVFHNLNNLAVVSTAGFTKGAIDLANKAGVVLLSPDQLGTLDELVGETYASCEPTKPTPIHTSKPDLASKEATTINPSSNAEKTIARAFVASVRRGRISGKKFETIAKAFNTTTGEGKIEVSYYDFAQYIAIADDYLTEEVELDPTLKGRFRRSQIPWQRKLGNDEKRDRILRVQMLGPVNPAKVRDALLRLWCEADGKTQFQASHQLKVAELDQL